MSTIYPTSNSTIYRISYNITSVHAIIYSYDIEIPFEVLHHALFISPFCNNTLQPVMPFTYFTKCVDLHLAFVVNVPDPSVFIPTARFHKLTAQA